MTENFRVYTHEEQRAMSAQGFREMVNAEGRSEDDDGVCRQPMVWLRKTGQRAIAADRTFSGSFALEATHALAKAGFLFPIPRNSGLYMDPCCDTAWCPLDDLSAEDVWCCKERSDALWAIEPNPIAKAEDRQLGVLVERADKTEGDHV